jgi:hypothetical protein
VLRNVRLLQMDALPADKKITVWLDAEIAETTGVVLVEGKWVFHVLRLADGTHIALTPEALEANTSAYEGS